MRNVYLLFIFLSCSYEVKELDIQGHRGARGLMPENTMPGFLYAIDIGVTTLEMDIVVTKDNHLLVSHEPFFSNEMCADSTGERVSVDTLLNIYKMSVEEVHRFDCGNLDHPRFPNQKKMAAVKPRLIDVIDAVENYQNDSGAEKIEYNIELKSRIETDDKFHPRPAIFSELVFNTLNPYELGSRLTIQSFDFRTLQYFNENHPAIKLALLIENQLSWKDNLDSLGFTPDIYSSNYQLLSRTIIKELQNEGMQVIPWTVNDPTEMIELIEWGVDGLITDYPNRAVELKVKK